MDPYNQFRYILEAMHIEEPQFDQIAYEDAVRLYPHLDSYPLLREILDTFIVPKLKARLSFGNPGDGTLFEAGKDDTMEQEMNKRPEYR